MAAPHTPPDRGMSALSVSEDKAPPQEDSSSSPQPSQTPSKAMPPSHPGTPNEDALRAKYSKKKAPPPEVLATSKLRDSLGLHSTPVNGSTPLQLPKRLVSAASARLEARGDELKRKCSSMTERSPEGVQALLDMKLESVNTWSSYHESVRETLREQYDAKAITKDEYDRLMNAIADRAARSRREKHAVVGKRRKISEHLLSMEGSNLEKAYSDLMCTYMEETHGATFNVHRKRTAPVQEKFSKDVFDFYDAKSKDPKKSGWKWCAVTAGWHQGNQIKAAHIIPAKLDGQVVLAAMGRRDLLEDPMDIVWGPQNGVPMLAPVEEAFDSGRCVIYPIEDASPDSPVRLKIKVLDKSLFLPDENDLNVRSGERTYWTEIDGAELRFLHPTNRPRKRNLFFHFVTTLLRREFYEPPNWWEDSSTVDDISGIWATPGSYLRRGTLQHMIRLVGDTGPESPLAKIKGRLIEDHTYDEEIRLPEEDDEDPPSAGERMGDKTFDQAVLRTADEEDKTDTS
ncbi:hypothetical protein LTR86_003808 [Recurvomyces mirabilis]|nr:hypothetical protein LTR86_003808 [Recurvomyces mirabilis]